MLLCAAALLGGACGSASLKGSDGGAGQGAGPTGGVAGHAPGGGGAGAAGTGGATGTGGAAGHPSNADASVDGRCSACPNGLSCAASGCLTSCSTDQDCQPNFHCTAPLCLRNAEANCLDGLDDNGDGLVDCADPTCVNQRVACVPASTAPLGYVATGCETGFAPTHINQGLVVPTTCSSGCGCDLTQSCEYDLYGDKTGDGCVAQSFLIGSFSSPSCLSYTSSSTTSFFSVSAVGTVHATCTGKGTGVPDAAHYTTQSNFCVAGRSPASAGCAAGQVCAALPTSRQAACALVSGATCPAAYPVAASSWNEDGISDQRTCSCTGCTVSGGACGATGLQFRVNNVPTTCGGSDRTCADTSCCGWFDHSGTGANYWSNGLAVGGVEVLSVPTPGATCSAVGTTSGTATAAAGTAFTVCCPQ